MRRLALALACALGAGAGPAAALEARTYTGSEAAALRCANTLAYTASALEAAGRMRPVDKEIMLAITVLILERHVSGTWPQKKAALKIVRDRRDLEQTFADFERYAAQCLVQFPIN